MTVVVAVTSVISLSLIGDCRVAVTSVISLSLIVTVVVAVTSVISLSLIGDCRSGCDFRDLTEPHWSLS